MNSEDAPHLLAAFYDAMGRRDADTMASLYSSRARFEDPVFRLEGSDIGRMWKGLLARAPSFSFSYTITRTEGNRGTVRLTAHYLFGGKRPVTNVIQSEMRFERGLIIEHRDSFDFAVWAAQALGLPGRLFGRFEWFQRAVSRKAANGLGLPPKSQVGRKAREKGTITSAPPPAPRR